MIIILCTEIDTGEQGPESCDDNCDSDVDSGDHDVERQLPGCSQRGMTLSPMRASKKFLFANLNVNFAYCTALSIILKSQSETKLFPVEITTYLPNICAFCIVKNDSTIIIAM